MDRRRERGQAGEQAAAELLDGLGYCIVERNFRTRYGELDIVAVDGDCLVFCEVRARVGTPESGVRHALESIGAGKRMQLRRMAGEWFRLSRADRPRTTSVRFDVVAVAVAADGRPLAIRHLPHAL